LTIINNNDLKLKKRVLNTYLYNKRACPTKNEPQQEISYLEREREGGERERGVGRGKRERCVRVRERERGVGG
jgi:hypothetical protein